jgi:tagatose 6-phosphate kinase
VIITLSTTPALQRTMTFASLQIDAVNRASEVAEYASGKSINAARVAHALGAATVTTGFLGGDRGRACRRDLDATGIAHDFVEVASQTRLCITAVDHHGGAATEMIEEAAPVRSDDAESLLAKLRELLQHAKVLVLSGRLAPGVGDDFYASCVRLAHEANVWSIVDAVGEPLRLALAERPFLIKPNRAELAATVRAHVVGEDLSLFDAMRHCIGLGAQWIVVTDGGRDSFVSDGTQLFRIPSLPVDVISPIGSGDAFAAGIAVALMRGDDVPVACTLGTACGAANATTALAGHVDRDTVERLANQIAPVAATQD